MRILLLASTIVLCTSIHGQYLADNTGVKDQDTERVFKAGEKAYHDGDLVLAIALFGRVLEQDPDHINAYLQRGFARGMDNDHEGSVQDFTAVLDREPGHLWAYISRGSALNSLGRYTEALSDLDAALRIDPRNAEAFNNRGWAHKGLGDQTAACKDWKASQRTGNAEARIILFNNRCK